MVHRGAVSGFVRFLCHIPLVFQAILGTKSYVYVKDHAQILLEPPYNKHNILLAEGFAGPGMIIAFAWNFCLWIPTILASNEILFYYGLVDAAIVVCLVYALCVESTFVGLTRSQCASIHANVTSDFHLLFFDRVATINVTGTELGQSMSYTFLAEWYMALSIAILYFVSAFFNLFASILFKDDDSYSSYSWHSRLDLMKRRLLWLGSPLIYVWKFLQTMPTRVLGFFPDHVQDRIRYFF